MKWHYHYINLSLTALRRFPDNSRPNWLFAQTDPDSSGSSRCRECVHTAHRLALNLVISSHCCCAPRSRDAQTRQIPSDLPSNAARGIGVHLPWSLHEPRQPCPPGDPDLVSALHRFASLLAPVSFTKTMDGTTQRQLLGHPRRHADGPTPRKRQLFAPVGRLLVPNTCWNSRQRYSSGNRPFVKAA